MIKKLLICIVIMFLATYNSKAAFVTATAESDAEKRIKAFTDAAYTNKKDKLEALLKEGIDINSKGPGGQTALQRAASQGHVEIVAFLLAQGAEANSADKQNITPLIAAVMSYPSRPNLPGIVSMVRMLIAKGAQIDAQNKSGQSALMIAIASQLIPVVQILLDAGANIWQKNSFNEGPLDLIDDKTMQSLVTKIQAASSEQEQNLLGQQLSALKQIKDIFLTQERTVKEFLDAANANDRGKIEALLSKGVPINGRDAQGRTALHQAASQGHIETVTLLLQKGGDIESKDATGQTLLHVAAGNGQVRMVEFLLEKGADPSSLDKENNTPLMTAILSYPKYKNPGALAKIVQVFLEKGVDLNHQNKSGQTALILATANGLDTIAQMLLDVGANVELQDDLSRKAIDWAQFIKNSTIENMLRKTNESSQEQKAETYKEALRLSAERDRLDREEARLKAEEAQRLEALRKQQEQEEALRREQEALRLKKLQDEARRQEELRLKKEREEALRREQEALRLKQQQEEACRQEELRLKKEREEAIRREQEALRLKQQQDEARRQEELRRKQEQEETLRREQEALRLKEEQDEARRQEELNRLPAALNQLAQRLENLQNSLQGGQRHKLMFGEAPVKKHQ